MNELRLNNIQIFGNKVIYNYDVYGEWKKYFIDGKELEISYSIDVSTVSKSIHVIPLICNILPIAWLCDATLYVDEIDMDFYENLDEVKSGYMQMYPMFEFNGKIVAADIKRNIPMMQNATATFFSGGVDAYTTLLRHINEKPNLITIWGADIKLDDVVGWENVKNHIENVSAEYGLEYIIIKSNFRSIINDVKLDQLVRESKDGWWHGFQHGIGLIGHMAPIAYSKGVKYTYIASSYPEKMKGKYTCASDPTIDNHVAYCGCKTIHDSYELDRQEKIRFLTAQKETGKEINLRVCWVSAGGKNCCSCEKCYRTILEIVSEGGDPNEYGFVWDEQHIRRCKRDMCQKITLAQFNVEQFYYPIQQRMKENAYKIADYKKYEWLLKLDFSNFNNYPMKNIRKTLIWRIVRKLLRRSK